MKPNPKYAHLAFTDVPCELKTVKVALSHPSWMTTMHEEMAALRQNHTWDFVPCQPNMNVIGCKWVFKTKL